jgi:plastocyanin
VRSGAASARLGRVSTSRFLACALVGTVALACSDEPAGPAADATKVADGGVSDGLARSIAEFERIAPAAGAIEGLVVFDGDPPARVPIDTSAEGGCGVDPSAPALTETWVVDAGRFANVFVWLENPPATESAAPSEPLVLAQKGCVYRPHASAIRVGQKLLVTNDDRARHNVHTLARADANPNVNLSQSEGAPAIELVFGAPEVAVRFVCDLHPWMSASVGVFDHPYFAVTGADGRFTFAGLPPGAYRLRAWHEALGKLTAEATVAADSGARVRMTYRPKT